DDRVARRVYLDDRWLTGHREPQTSARGRHEDRILADDDRLDHGVGRRIDPGEQAIWLALVAEVRNPDRSSGGHDSLGPAERGNQRNHMVVGGVEPDDGGGAFGGHPDRALA